jgi:hypothetical protein
MRERWWNGVREESEEELGEESKETRDTVGA